MTYDQMTGILRDDQGNVIAAGYSGHLDGRNNPQAAAVHAVGPLPVGKYTIGAPMTVPVLGPLAFPLTPQAGTETYGRSGFWIHGDNSQHPGLSSDGCIVLEYVWRSALTAYVGETLEVVNAANKYSLPPSS